MRTNKFTNVDSKKLPSFESALKRNSSYVVNKYNILFRKLLH